MPRCEPVERTTLLANFLTMPSEVVDNLRTLIVGPDYAARKADPDTGTNFIGAYEETTGVASTWPSLSVGEVLDTTTAEVFVSQCLVRFFLENIASPNASNGVQNGAFPNEIIHDSGSTIWAGSSRTGNVPTDVIVGDHIYLTTDNAGANAFETTVTGFKYTTGNPTVLVLADNLPAAFTGGAFFNINVDEIVAEQTLADSDFTATAASITVSAGVTVSTTRTGGATPIYSGTSPYSQTYVNYRAIRQTNGSSIISLSTTAELDTYFVGWEFPESGLGFAMARALAPQGGTATLPTVLGAAIATNDAAGWGDTLSRVRRRTDWYTLAPLTTDSAIHTLVTNTLSDRDSLGLVSRAFLALELTETENLFTGTEAVVVSGGGDLTLTTTNPIFLTAIAGDTVTTNIGTFTIASKTSNQEVVVTTAATGSTTVTSVDHSLTVSEQTTDYGTRAQAFANRAVSVIFPPDPTWNGTVVEGFLYAAASAGLRGYTTPHQSLRGVVMEDSWAVPQSTYEFLGELDALAVYGCHVSQDCDGDAGVLFANTTDQSTTEDRTEGLVANADAVTRYFNDLVACFAGRTKVTLDTLSELRATASTGVEFLKSQTSVAGFGSIIVDGTVGAPFQDPNNLDTVVLPVSVTLSATLEYITVNIAVTLEVV